MKPKTDFNLLANVCNQLEKLVLEYVNQESAFNHHFPNLSELTIYRSKIFVQKKFLDRFPSLQSLRITTLQLRRQIDPDAFLNLTKLITLDLSNIDIEKLEKKHFSKLIHLEKLDLSENQIRCIEKNMFENLKNLNRLDLSRNKLEKLDPESFIRLVNLKELNLNSNEFVDFDFGILDKLPKIETLNISHSIPNYKSISNMLFQRGIYRYCY